MTDQQQQSTSSDSRKESRGTVKPWLDAALGFLYPNVCQICDENRADCNSGYVCEACRNSADGVRWLEPPFCARCGLPFSGEIASDFECPNCIDFEPQFDFARASVRASELLLDCVHRYKYNRAIWLEPFFTVLMQQAHRVMAGWKWDMIVPVPLHPVKLREREFNQAERLARMILNPDKRELNTTLLKRVEYTVTQTALSKRKRAENMKGAFQIAKGRSLNGERILLIDDVLTTGATASACAEILKSGGAGQVGVWTLVRAGK